MSVHKLDARFGMVPAHSRLLSDRSATLTLPEMKQLRAQLRLFHKKFPQSLLSVFVTELPANANVREYAFWMANRARFTAADRVRSENFNLLFVIDIAHGGAALTTGYGLENYVPESALQRALDDFAAAAQADGLAPGISACIESLVRQLRELATQAKGQAELEGAARGSETW
ncbi:MAG: TPM domain-containing protein [Verrucomicrobiota bacterium]|nr:TPM domain-containing protein [Verrucomicrobiota bacterium]